MTDVPGYTARSLSSNPALYAGLIVLMMRCARITEKKACLPRLACPGRTYISSLREAVQQEQFRIHDDGSG